MKTSSSTSRSALPTRSWRRANRRLKERLTSNHRALTRGENDLELLREVLEQLPQPVLALGDEGVIAFANSHADALLGAVGPLTGKPLVEALPALDGMLCRHQMQGVAGRRWSPTRAGRRPDRTACSYAGRRSARGGDARGRIVTLIATDAEEILQ